MAGQTETLIETILQWIDIGRLKPGDLIDDAALVAEFSVSRTPVREALLQLEAVGLIRRHPRKGATLFRPTLEEFLAILEVHAKLEGQAAGLAARRLSTGWAARLEAAVLACEAHAAEKGDSDPDGYYQLNLRFHETVALAAGLVWSLAGPPLPDLLDRFLDLLGRGAVPCALFALGATMTGYRIAGDLKDSAAIVALKLGLHPLIVWLVATQIFALSPLHTAVATIVASLPVGVNVFILARAYDTYVRRSASAVLISTALSVVTTGLVLAQFARG